jgi:hypothetical protein
MLVFPAVANVSIAFTSEPFQYTVEKSVQLWNGLAYCE